MKKKSSVVLCAVMLLLSMTSCATEPTTQTSSVNSTQTDSLTPTQANAENPTTSTASSSTVSEETTSENRVHFDDFSIVLPENWCYEENVSGYSVVFYEKQVYEETSYGMLVGIAKYNQELPGTTLGSEYLGEHNGYYFYSGSPTSPDVDTSDTELLNLWNTAYAQVEDVLATIEWCDNEENDKELITINTNDTLTFTGTLSSEYYEINSNNKGTVNILELDSPFSCYLNDGGFNYDGQTEYLIDSIQVSFSDGISSQEYYDTNITVTGTVMLANTGHHRRDIVLLDSTITSQASTNSNAGTDTSKLILGTWVAANGDPDFVLTFNSDGSCDIKSEDSRDEAYMYYTVSGEQLTLYKARHTDPKTCNCKIEGDTMYIDSSAVYVRKK